MSIEEKAAEIARGLGWGVKFAVQSIAQDGLIYGVLGDRAAIHQGLATYEPRGDQYVLALTPLGLAVASHLKDPRS